MTGIVKAVCVSRDRGTPKQDVGSARLQEGWGLLGDAHGGKWHRQVSLLSADKVADFAGQGSIAPGAFGENLLVEGIDFGALPVGTRLRCGAAVLEITQIGKECHSHCEIHERMGDCIMPREGVFARVLSDGVVSVGREMEVLPPAPAGACRAAVITLSDRGARGERADSSGPLVRELLEEQGYRVEESLLLPDGREELERALIRLCDEEDLDLILTTGGTGFAPRDLTPEATLAVAHRNAPGIAEAIRAHSMTITGRAMLSRGVSVIRGSTLIVNLPGSPKAVGECLAFALPHLRHGIQLLRDRVESCGEEEQA